jgi:hypothetical protein
MEIIMLKKLLSGSSLLLLFILFFIQASIAQVQTKSILYLKNGSAIKCNLVRIVPDSLFIIQTSDSNQWGYRYDQVDSLGISRETSSVPPSETNIVPKSSQSSAAGFFLGMGSPMGEDAGRYDDGLFVGAQFGSGKSPGFLFQFGFLSIAASGSLTSRVTFYSTLGFRIKTDLLPLGLFISPSFGLIHRDEAFVAMGLALDIYVVPKVFLGTKFLTSTGNTNSSSSRGFSFIAFVIGYGVN